MRVEEAVAAIEACETVDELRDTLQRVVADYGFSGFGFVDAGQPHKDEPFYFGTTGPAWEEEYRSNGFAQVDPALVRVRRTNTPFTWGMLELPPVTGKRKPGAVKTMEAARDHGFTEGFVLPFHFRDRLGNLHSTSTAFFWKDKASQLRFLLGDKKHELHLVMIYWVQRAMDIVARDHRGNPVTPSPGAGEGGVFLTDRERDVMAWAARGKTVSDTADILKISDETVETHVRNALRKLEATNKTHGVAKCLSLGLIDL
ncbi:MAG TPA: LuxR C-terminal-related transcriptional regulator [Microvirga sp.]|nr:LuxR C-terminal-related transcriptional regulator [Microvirga sp.]